MFSFSPFPSYVTLYCSYLCVHVSNCHDQTSYYFVFQAEPYLKGEVIPMRDSASESPSDVLSSDISAVKDAVYSLNSLEIKLKVCVLTWSLCLCFF